MPERERPIRMKVIDAIRTDVTSGAYVGTLPSMDKLAERLGASRVTVRNALKYLEAEGLLRIRQGQGTFVNVPGESQKSITRGFAREFPRDVNESIGHYLRFLSNSQIPEEIRVRTMQIINAQISLVEQSQQPTINPK